MREDRVFEADWSRRRRAVAFVNLYCGIGIIYLLGWGNDGALHVNIALGLIGLATAVNAGYLGLPYLDDRDRRRQFVGFRSSLPPEQRATGTTTGRVDEPS